MALNVNQNVRVIVVARPCDDFRWQMTFLLDRLNVEYTLCLDIYHALAEIQHRTDLNNSHVVVGTLQELCRENMRFLNLCQSRNDTICCCLVTAVFHRNLAAIKTAIENSTFVAADIKEVETFIGNILKSPRQNWNLNTLSGIGNNEPGSLRVTENLVNNNVILTRAELDALSGKT